MPTYEYECTKCRKVFDLFQAITEPRRRKLKDAAPKPCNCNASVLRRISTGGGIIFKGSGFYQTDYRSESYKQAARAECETASGKSNGNGSGKKEKAGAKQETKCGT